MPVGWSRPQSPPRRAVIYARISDDRSGEALGVERQETECRAEAGRLGYRVTLVETDNSISAYSGKRRPGFEAVLAHVRAGRADVLLCWHLDRLARQIKDLQRVLDLCTGRNAPCPSLVIHPARGSEIRDNDWSAQLTASILTLVADFESAHKGERVAAEARQRALTGRFFYPKVYRYSDEGDRAPVEPQASAMQTAYATFLRTWSVAATHRTLKAADPKSAPAGESGTRKLLQRPAYAGIVTYKGVEHPEVQALWEPLVPEPDWHTTQAILSRPSRLHGQHFRDARTNLLSGLAQCGRCGGTMRASGHKGESNTGRDRELTCRDYLHLTRKAFPIKAYVIGLCMARLGLADAQAAVLPRDPDPRGIRLSNSGTRSRASGPRSQTCGCPTRTTSDCLACWEWTCLGATGLALTQNLTYTESRSRRVIQRRAVVAMTTPIGVLIERAREAASLSQRALADVTGISQSTLSRVISGDRVAKMPEIVLIAEATGHTVAQLTGTGTVAGRVQCAARATSDSGMEQMRQALLHFLELDDYLDDQAIPATV